jgi:hypothetical protein
VSIKITIQAPDLNISANLKDEALIIILQLIQEQRQGPVDEIISPKPAVEDLDFTLPGDIAEKLAEEDTKSVLKTRGGAELLNQFKWDRFPEKILLLGAWLEARGGAAPWRSADMDDTFRLAKESPPANFPRDIKNAIRSGWIHNETPRTYIVTRTGWNKIGQSLRGFTT